MSARLEKDGQERTSGGDRKPLRAASGTSRFRRARRMALRPMLVGLVLLVVGLAASAPACASPARSAKEGATGLSEGAAPATDPLVIPGTYVTFICTHGTISLDGTQYCSHTTTVGVDLCDNPPSCGFSMVGTVDSGYTFYGWVLSGQDSVGCGSCLSTTLTVYTLTQGGHYTASVNVSTTPPPTDTITVHTFENWTNGWIPAVVQTCRGSTCQNVTNGNAMVLTQGYAYNVSAIRMPYYASVHQWTTNAGYLSNTTNTRISFTPETNGILSLIVKYWPGSWAGYIYSPPTSSGTVSSVSASFTVPSNSQSGAFAVWVGIGGLGIHNKNVTALWQAGIEYNTSSTIPYAWWEACYANTIGLCPGYSKLDYGYNHGFNVHALDTLVITVAFSGGTCVSSMRDTSEPDKPYWNGTYSNVSFSPNTQSGEWILEHMDPKISLDKIPMSNLTINGAFPTLYASFLDSWDQTVGWLATSLSAGLPTFTIYHGT